MGKYWQIYKMKFQTTMMYRGALILHRIGTVLMMVTMICLWVASKSQGLMGGYTKDDLVDYYLFGAILNSIVYWWPQNNIKNEIKDGEIGPKALSKPISYYWMKFFDEFSWHTVSPIFGILSVIVAIVILGIPINMTLNLPSLFLITSSVFLGSILFFNMSSCLGLLTFWFTETNAIGTFAWAGTFILGGQSLPLSFFPQNFQILLKLLPFRYIFSFPAEIFLNRLNSVELFWGFLIQIFWLSIFGLIYKILWHFGVKKYSAFGG